MSFVRFASARCVWKWWGHIVRLERFSPINDLISFPENYLNIATCWAFNSFGMFWTHTHVHVLETKVGILGLDTPSPIWRGARGFGFSFLGLSSTGTALGFRHSLKKGGHDSILKDRNRCSASSLLCSRVLLVRSDHVFLAKSRFLVGWNSFFGSSKSPAVLCVSTTPVGNTVYSQLSGEFWAHHPPKWGANLQGVFDIRKAFIQAIEEEISFFFHGVFPHIPINMGDEPLPPAGSIGVCCAPTKSWWKKGCLFPCIKTSKNNGTMKYLTCIIHVYLSTVAMWYAYVLSISICMYMYVYIYIHG